MEKKLGEVIVELKYIFKRPCIKCGELHDTCLMNSKKRYIMRRMEKCKKCLLCSSAEDIEKEPEKGDKDINVLRTEDALETNPEIIATGCPYCNTMMTDGVKFKEKEADVLVLDIAELIAQANEL